jgi:hypothetical protein
MSGENWTPGPWFAEPLDSREVFGGNRAIATAHGRDSEALGNGLLIAAAPELYEALKSLWKWVDNWGADFIFDPEFEGEPERIKAALRKARGEE